MDYWKNKIAVVTGASSGIGRAIALELAKHGMKVIVIARRQDRLIELEKESNGKIIAKPGDIMNDEEVENIFKWIEKGQGPISVIVNNAGVSYKAPILDSNYMSKIKQMFDLNVLALVKCTQCAYKTMSTLDRGQIININSIAGHDTISFDDGAIYGATKHAVTVITKGLIKELATKKSNIRVTSISPGVVRTEIFKVGSWGDNVCDYIPCLEPVNIAEAVISALSAPANAIYSEITVKPVGETA